MPLRRIVRDLRAAGVPADISGDAGTLMCNHLMYGILHACSGRDIVAGWVHLPALPVRLGVLILRSRRWRRAPRRRCDVGHTQEMAAKDENLGMPSMTAELSTRAVLRVAASVVEGSKQGDISDAVKSRLLV